MKEDELVPGKDTISPSGFNKGCWKPALVVISVTLATVHLLESSRIGSFSFNVGTSNLAPTEIVVESHENEDAHLFVIEEPDAGNGEKNDTESIVDLKSDEVQSISQNGIEKELPLQFVSNEILRTLSAYRFQLPLKPKIEDEFPTDSTLLERLQHGRLTEEEAAAFYGKRLVFLGDSIDANMLMDVMLTCKRDASHHTGAFSMPKLQNVTCTYLSGGNKKIENMDYMFLGRFEKYNLEFALHRASYGYEVNRNAPGVVHKSFAKGSRLYKANTTEERYKIILEDSFANLPDMHRADLLLINFNMWVRYRVLGRRPMYELEFAVDRLLSFYQIAKDFFSPKAIAYHTIPRIRDGTEVDRLNNFERKAADRVGAGLFDWEEMTSLMRKKGLKHDGRHPGDALNIRFANLMLAWMLETFTTEMQ